MHSHCLWDHTAREPRLDYPRLEEDLDVDVAIIGAGITGLSSALHLSRGGARVALLERAEIHHGGSGRNVGLVNAGLWIPPDDILDLLGHADGERATEMLGNGPREVFSLVDEFAIDCDATRSGTLHLAHDQSGVADLKRRYAQLSRRGAPVELLSQAECVQAVGSDKIPLALLDRRAGTLNPAAYTRGLARAATALGARIFTHSAVESLRRERGGWQLQCAAREVRAERVILATNAYTEGEWNAVGRHFYRGYYFQVASQPLADDQAAGLLPERQGCWDTRAVLSSIRRDAQGRLLLGSLGSGECKPAHYLECWARRVQAHYFSQLAPVRWETAWTGVIGFTPDHTLRLFEPAPGLLAASGYNGRGITTGTVIGKGFARYCLDGDQSALPLPLREYSPVRCRRLRSRAINGAFFLYHLGQCIKVIG